MHVKVGNKGWHRVHGVIYSDTGYPLTGVIEVDTEQGWVRRWQRADGRSMAAGPHRGRKGGDKVRRCELCRRPIQWSYDTEGKTECCSSCWEIDLGVDDRQRRIDCGPNGHGPFDYGTGGGIRIIRKIMTE